MGVVRLRKKPFTSFILLMVVSFLVLSGCGNQSSTGGDSGSKDSKVEQGSIKIGLLIEQTGFFSWYGKENLNSAELVVEQVNAEGGINGRKLELSTYDTASSPESSVSGYKKFTNDKVDAVVGLGLVNGMMAVKPMVNNGPLMYTTSGAYRPAGDPYTFGGTVFAGDMQRRAVKWIKEQGYESFALLTTNDDTGQQASGSLEKIAGEFGVDLTAIEYFNSTDVSVTSQLTKIKGEKPEALIAWVVGKPLGVVFQGIQQVDLNVPVIGSHGNLSPGFLKSLADFQPKQLYVPATKDIAPQFLDSSDPQHSVIQDFVKAYSDKYSENPGLGSGATFDVMNLLVKAFGEVGTDREAVAKYLEGLKDFVGVAGTYKFSADDHRGLNEDDAVMLKIVNGEFQKE